MPINKNNLAWIDLEMTGLNANTDRIIEIGTLVTDEHLMILSEGPTIAIRQHKNVLKSMNTWNKNVHSKSGLTSRVLTSMYNEKLAETITLEFLKQWLPKNKSPICGNSISTDRKFLLKYMPDLEKFFHYRQIDVSTIKELVKRWNPNVYKKLKKKVFIQFHKI